MIPQGKIIPLKFSTFTDESGQDTRGRVFVVVTICVPVTYVGMIENELLEIEKKSGKSNKWYDTRDKRRIKYVESLLSSAIWKNLSIYFSIYQNKNEYTTLIGAHIAKSVLDYATNEPYEAKVFIDKVNNKVLEKIRQEIKSFHIQYKKIRGVSEETSCFIRLADAICGLIRDLENKKVLECYKDFFKKLIEV